MDSVMSNENELLLGDNSSQGQSMVPSSEYVSNSPNIDELLKKARQSLNERSAGVATTGNPYTGFQSDDGLSFQDHILSNMLENYLEENSGAQDEQESQQATTERYVTITFLKYGYLIRILAAILYSVRRMKQIYRHIRSLLLWTVLLLKNVGGKTMHLMPGTKRKVPNSGMRD